MKIKELKAISSYFLSTLPQLKYTDKSVKEIAMQMDFPNVSFFGKYFKTHVGVSPMEYRKGK